MEGVSAAPARLALRVSTAALAVAAFAHALRYLLLVVNRDVLLHPVVAGGAVWLGVAASAAALAAVIGCAIVLTRWLVARRAAEYRHHRGQDPRSTGALWAGCLVPVVNLAWAPIFVIEAASLEGIYTRLRKSILVWWVLWVLSTAMAMFAIATSFTTNAQGIADNTVTTTLAYLVALAVVVVLTRVYEGFVCKPVDRPAHRWVVVGSGGDDSLLGEPAMAAGTADRQPVV